MLPLYIFKYFTELRRQLIIVYNDDVESCFVLGQYFPLGRPFSFKYDCYKYNCDCHTNGSWECPPEKAEYNCIDDPTGNYPIMDAAPAICKFLLSETR